MSGSTTHNFASDTPAANLAGVTGLMAVIDGAPGLVAPSALAGSGTVDQTARDAAATAESAATAAAATADAAIPATEKGEANGVASLGSDGKVPAAQLPAASTVDQTARDAAASAEELAAAAATPQEVSTAISQALAYTPPASISADTALTSAQAGFTLLVTAGVNITVPDLGAGVSVSLLQLGAAEFTVLAGSGVTLQYKSGAGAKSGGQYSGVTVVGTGTGTVVVLGGSAS